MKSCASACRQAASISASVASGRPMSRFSRIVRLNSMLSWNTTPIARRRLSSVTSRRSCPSIAMRPETGSHSRCSRLMAVDLPAPVWPTSAVAVPGRAVKLTSVRMFGPPG